MKRPLSEEYTDPCTERTLDFPKAHRSTKSGIGSNIRQLKTQESSFEIQSNNALSGGNLASIMYSDRQSPRPQSNSSSIISRQNSTSSKSPTTSTHTILAIAEGRGISSEIGICSLNLQTSICTLGQYNDSISFNHTFQYLNHASPSMVILCSRSIDPPSKLYQAVGSYILEISKMVDLPRQHFNESEGVRFLKKLSLACELESLLGVVENRYYTLAAVSAVFSYVDSFQNILFKNSSIKFSFTAIQGTVLIDIETSKHLELIVNGKNNKNCGCLFGVLNLTKTQMGARLLRSSILQPLTSMELIKGRQLAVQELIDNAEVFSIIQENLKDFADVDHLISSYIQVPRNSAAKYSMYAINRMLQLKQIMSKIVTLRDVLDGKLTSNLNLHVFMTFTDEKINELVTLLNKVIDPDVVFQKSSLGIRNQRCFAVNSGYNGLLDVARQTYKEANDDVNELHEGYIALYQYPIKLNFSEGVGYSLSLAKDSLGNDRLPDIFINVTETSKTFKFTTLKIMCQNDRIKQSLCDIYAMSSQAISDLMIAVHEYLPVLYQMSESLALLDFLQSLAQAAKTHGYVCPEFGNVLALKDARHPILETLIPECIPNDMYSDDSVRMQMITGPNMSGKTTYLNQIALITIMAHIGSFVPCAYASIKPIDKILTRIGHDDHSVAQVSSFTKEMKEVANILSQATENSLVIIDELGRGTSTSDGVAVTIAVCEDLLEKQAMVFFATHFAQVTSIFENNPNVVSLHLSIQNSVQNQITDICSKFEYKIKNGICRYENYGLELAKTVGIPSDILETAKSISSKLEKSWDQLQSTNQNYKNEQQLKLKLRCISQLILIMRNSHLPIQQLRNHLKTVQSEFKMNRAKEA
ncbi:muts domain V-domain-containing protein [Globomyces pollinis-pini]|nr:muts domain V-domain-containing protein [Globomyces pollinis-pini]